MLKSLEVSGFKSFAKKTELQFKSQITAIVGPNGSGKSNVAEAFRFVLGEQSMKSMRGKRGEDMIWNGGAEVSKSNRANVKIILDNTNNFFSALSSTSTKKESTVGGDFEEVVIERTVNRDGSNEYSLNGSVVRLKDVIELLSQAHIGVSGHHIISQGEADRILTANIKERKEMIEDALGLKIYQYKREGSQKKLSKTEENIKQVESLRREIVPHIKFLKKQVEKVERTEELRTKLVKFYREYLKREQIYLENEKGKIETEKKPLTEKFHHLEKEMERAKTILENSAKKDGKSEELLEIENEVKKERENKDKLFREIGKIEGEVSANQRNIEKIRAEMISEENKMVPLKEIEKLEREISMYVEISKIVQKIREFIGLHKANFEDKNLQKLEESVFNLEKEKIKFEEKILEIDKKLLELDFKYNEIKNSIEKEKDTERDAEKNIFRVSSEMSEARGRLDFINEKLHRLSIEENDWKREIAEGGVLLGTAILGFENDMLEEENQENRQERRRELDKMKIRLEELGGADGAEMTKEYKETVERDEFLQKELEDLKKSAESLEVLIKELLEKLDIEFKQGVEKINDTFHEYFVLMFGGGEARLEVVKEKIRKIKDLLDDEDGLVPRNSEELQSEVGEEGIDINVSLPRKKIKGLEMLSGGERTLTSIALLFAISQVNPPPFVILDETDAALDEANSKKYGDMIESLSKVSQLILITHNRETMSRADVIYGVTMGRDGVSRLLSIAFDEAVAVTK
ncbi:MAG: AAA family ATPase [Patescibacteria group bacterium]